MAANSQWHAVGRRKRSIARVYLRPGSGAFNINGTASEGYFLRKSLLLKMRQPLELTETTENFDIYVNVRGGGKSGQADAIKLGLSRALQDFDPKLRPALKKAGFLTRDAREVERKKYGQPGARKRFQFSKR